MPISKPCLSILVSACHLAGTLHASAEAPDSPQPASKPNIIFVIADDMGCMDTGYSGNPVVKTPHLDQMAAEGLRLETARKSNTETIALYDLVADPDQKKDLAAEQPEKVKEMLKALAVWRESVKQSFAGKDYIR